MWKLVPCLSNFTVWTQKNTRNAFVQMDEADIRIAKLNNAGFSSSVIFVEKLSDSGVLGHSFHIP